MDVRSDIFPGTPDGFHPRDVSVRLARPDERIRWDRLMDQLHYLGFKRFAGRGQRYVFEWRGQWVGLASWQSGAFKCRPRDQWIGWKRELQFTRMHLIANNTRFLILGAPGCFPNLASLALAAMVQRLSADWSAAYGHCLLLAETFVDPSKFCGHMYKEAGWTRLGQTKGYARANGRYTDPHGVPKDLHVFPLHRDTRSRMCAPDPLPDPLLPNPMGDASEQPLHGLSSVYEEFLRVPDFRRAQGRKHTIASVLTIDTVASLSGFEFGFGAAQFARALNQTELKMLGAWFNPKTEKYEPPSKSVIYRVREKADPAAMETVLKRWSMPRLNIDTALAADGKRLRGANRNGDGHFETATLVAHDTGLPVASHGFHDESGERAAIAALFEEVPLARHVITLNALHQDVPMLGVISGFDPFTEESEILLAFCCAYRYAGVMDVRSDIFPGTPDGFHPRDVSVRLARPDERIRWDRLMDQHHYLGFKRFAGHGVRYVFDWRGQWVGLAGWQSGAFKCRPRDQWIGWKRELQFTRMHLIANNTRFLILGAPGCFPNLASLALAAMVQRLSADWSAAYGHSLLLAETFVDPSKFCGYMYKAAGWTQLGRTKGYARANGRYTDPHGVLKDLHVFPLHRDTRSRMCAPDPLPDPLLPNPMGDASGQPPHGLNSVYEEFLRVPDFRRAQGRKHTIESVFAIVITARLAGFETGIGAAQFARALNQTELKSFGAWFNPKTKKYEPPSKSIIYRVLERSDPAETESVLKGWSTPRLKLGSALAADGKRLRGANRNGDGHFETATLVAHDTGLPVASHSFHDESGERAAIAALFEEVPLARHVITVDALHTVRDTARSIVEIHNTDYLMTVKANAPETFKTLSTINWNRDATGAFEEEPTKEHGRIECRRIQTMTPLPGTVNFPHIAQIFRIERDREMCKSGKKALKSPTESLQFQRTGAHLKTCLHGTAVIGRSKTATIGRETSTSERMPASATRRTAPPTVQSATTSRSRSSSAEVPKSLKRDATSICIVTKR